GNGVDSRWSWTTKVGVLQDRGAKNGGSGLVNGIGNSLARKPDNREIASGWPNRNSSIKVSQK
ncbi:hypothetical protein U1Q18_048025, partial [Sarracenia purpurea var. burkii]